MRALLARVWCWFTGRCPVARMEYEEAARRSAEVRAYIELQARVLNDQRRSQ